MYLCIIYIIVIFSICIYYIDNKLSFPPRDVTIKRGVDAKEFYDLLTEVGR